MRAPYLTIFFCKFGKHIDRTKTLFPNTWLSITYNIYPTSPWSYSLLLLVVTFLSQHLPTIVTTIVNLVVVRASFVVLCHYQISPYDTSWLARWSYDSRHPWCKELLLLYGCLPFLYSSHKHFGWLECFATNHYNSLLSITLSILIIMVL